MLKLLLRFKRHRVCNTISTAAVRLSLLQANKVHDLEQWYMKLIFCGSIPMIVSQQLACIYIAI